MKCDIYQDVNYGTELYCRLCGMDVGLEMIKKKGKTYCCEDCANEKN